MADDRLFYPFVHSGVWPLHPTKHCAPIAVTLRRAAVFYMSVNICKCLAVFSEILTEMLARAGSPARTTLHALQATLTFTSAAALLQQSPVVAGGEI